MHKSDCHQCHPLMLLRSPTEPGQYKFRFYRFMFSLRNKSFKKEKRSIFDILIKVGFRNNYVFYINTSFIKKQITSFLLCDVYFLLNFQLKSVILKILYFSKIFDLMVDGLDSIKWYDLVT